MQRIEQFKVNDSSNIGEARRSAVKIGDFLGFDEQARGRIAIVSSELATNLIKHAGGGDFIVIGERSDRGNQLDIFASDQGPGMANVACCMQDGYSTSGTAGGGLGALSRQADEFDIFSKPNLGTVVYCGFRNGKPSEDHHPRLEVGALNFPYPGEWQSGDSTCSFDCASFGAVIVADGLGHGPEAHLASQLAIKTFQEKVDLGPQPLLEAIHRALIGTRGAAIGIARIDYQSRELSFSGLGNISGLIYNAEKVHSLFCMDGIVGHNARRFQVQTYPWARGSVLTMQSDGLSGRCRLDNSSYLGLASRSPSLIAAVLMRDGRRGKDDACVVVARQSQCGGARD